MNVRVEAGPLQVSIVASLVPPVVSTQFNMVRLENRHQKLTWTCLSPALSINGHSLNAINPDFLKVGELTTLVLA